MIRLLVITSPDNHTDEYYEYWEDHVMNCPDFLQIVDGKILNVSDSNSFFEDLKKMGAFSTNTGIVVHSPLLYSWLKEKNDELAFVKSYSSQAGDSYAFNVGKREGIIFELYSALNKDDQNVIREVTDFIIKDNTQKILRSEKELFTGNLRTKGFNNLPYSKLLFLCNRNFEPSIIAGMMEAYEIKPFILQKISDENHFEKSGRLITPIVKGNSVFIVNDKSILDDFEKKDNQSINRFLNQFDLILIDNELNWLDEKYDGYDIGQKLMSLSSSPLNLVYLSEISPQTVVSKVYNLKRHIVKVARHWMLPIKEPFKKVTTSSTKWEAIKLSMTTGGIIDKWIHDIKHQTSISSLKAFINEICNYKNVIKDELLIESVMIENDEPQRVQEKLKSVLLSIKDGAYAIKKLDVKVLVVEDNDYQRKRIHERLESDYFKSVISVGSGKKAMDLISTTKFDILISDLELLENPLDSESVYQEYWGIDIVEYAQRNYPNIVICVLTAMPKANVEGIFNVNASLRGEVEILFKQDENDYLPADYLWRVELDRLVAKVKSKIDPEGPQLGKWKVGGEFRTYFEHLSEEEKKDLWISIENDLVNFKYEYSISKNWGKTNKLKSTVKNLSAQKEVLKRIILTRLLIMKNFESDSNTSWSKYFKKVFDVDYNEVGEMKSKSVKDFNTYLGMSYASEKINYQGRQFDKEIEILNSLDSKRKNVIIDNENREDLFCTIVYIGQELNEIGPEIDLEEYKLTFGKAISIIEKTIATFEYIPKVDSRKKIVEYIGKYLSSLLPYRNQINDMMILEFRNRFQVFYEEKKIFL